MVGRGEAAGLAVEDEGKAEELAALEEQVAPLAMAVEPQA